MLALEMFLTEKPQWLIDGDRSPSNCTSVIQHLHLTE